MRDVLIFARAPVLGTVKTRLAAGIGDAAALELYRHLLGRTVRRLASGDWRTRLCVTPDSAAFEVCAAPVPRPAGTAGRRAATGVTTGPSWPAGVARTPQGEGDLGERMRRCLDVASAAAPVVVVGSDIPALDAIHVARAFEALTVAPLVFGPARDGGFYLVGASAPPPRSFLGGVTWSSPTTLAEAVASCPSGVPPAFVDTLADLDDGASLVAHVVAGTLSP